MIQNTLFSEYISERENKKIVEDDRGFLIYRVIGEECFIADGFVSKAARGTSAFSDLLRHLFASAQAEGCKVVTANIHLSDGGAMRTLAAVLKRGFKVVAANHNILTIAKEV